jgi:hypothetical protein
MEAAIMKQVQKAELNHQPKESETLKPVKPETRNPKPETLGQTRLSTAR